MPGASFWCPIHFSVLFSSKYCFIELFAQAIPISFRVSNFHHFFHSSPISTTQYPFLTANFFMIHFHMFIQMICFLNLECFSELRVLQVVLPREKNIVIEILEFVKALDCYLNLSIAYRISLTIFVTVASVERSFS